jgi:hypothetical protein
MNKLTLLALLPLCGCLGSPGSEQGKFSREAGTGTCLGVAVAAGAGGGISVFPQGMVGKIEETATTCSITATDWRYPPGVTATPAMVPPAP